MQADDLRIDLLGPTGAGELNDPTYWMFRVCRKVDGQWKSWATSLAFDSRGDRFAAERVLVKLQRNLQELQQVMMTDAS